MIWPMISKELETPPGVSDSMGAKRDTPDLLSKRQGMVNGFLQKLRASPLAVRVAPFLVFATFTFFQGKLGEESKYWLYLIKSIAGVFLIWAVRPSIPELRWTISWEAVLIGVFVIIFWVALDPLYPKLSMASPEKPWNPNVAFGQGAPLARFFIATRILGATLVVPPLEEIFYRSFVYRYIIDPTFERVPLRRFHLIAFLVTSTVFGLSHREWLAGILCGFAYQWLVLRKGHLGDAITAHAISNLLLGAWVLYKEAWQFW
jgi:CAAX prenyl protease-like protein